MSTLMGFITGAWGLGAIGAAVAMDLSDCEAEQFELTLDDPGPDKSRLMSAMDTLNAQYGKGAIHLAGTGGHKTSLEWGMRQERRTPHYTTRLSDIPIARA